MGARLREAPRLSGLHIAALRTIVKASGGHPVLLNEKFRRAMVTLWRRDLVQIWYRQAVSSSLEGPFYSLTISGARLAGFFCQPRKPVSGASRNSRGGAHENHDQSSQSKEG